MALRTVVLSELLRFCTTTLGSERLVKTVMSADRTDAPVPFYYKYRFQVTTTESTSLNTTFVQPRGFHQNGYVIYIHGGAFVSPIMPAHWSIVNSLVHASNWTACVPSYSLLPQAGEDVVLSQLMELYLRLLGDSRPIVLAGDSAGAHLALLLAIQLINAGHAPPARLLLYSPWIDTTMATVPSYSSTSLVDNILDRDTLAYIGRLWRSKSFSFNILDQECLAHLPASVIYQGGRDILAADALQFAELVRRCGASCETVFYRDAFHSFVGTPFLPETQHAIRHSRQVLQDADQQYL